MYQLLGRSTSKPNHGACQESGDYQHLGRGRRNTISSQHGRSDTSKLFKTSPMRPLLLLTPVRSSTTELSLARSTAY
eukprot:1543922-Amphidinium_carterae.1